MCIGADETSTKHLKIHTRFIGVVCARFKNTCFFLAKVHAVVDLALAHHVAIFFARISLSVFCIHRSPTKEFLNEFFTSRCKGGKREATNLQDLVQVGLSVAMGSRPVSIDIYGHVFTSRKRNAAARDVRYPRRTVDARTKPPVDVTLSVVVRWNHLPTETTDRKAGNHGPLVFIVKPCWIKV